MQRPSAWQLAQIPSEAVAVRRVTCHCRATGRPGSCNVSSATSVAARRLGGVSKSDAAFWLGIYASVVASATGLWSLFRELWLERARFDVVASDAWLVKSGKMIIKGDDTLKTMGITPTMRTPILEVVVRNRGRRDAEIRTIGQARPDGGSFVFGDLLPQIPFEIPGERTKVLVMGDRGGYEHGSVSPKRFYVVDGANRIHPLRERYRQWLTRPFRRRRTSE